MDGGVIWDGLLKFVVLLLLRYGCIDYFWFMLMYEFVYVYLKYGNKCDYDFDKVMVSVDFDEEVVNK